MSPRISIRLLAAQPDQRLAALAGEGHERAFEALVQRYRRPLLRYCRGMRFTDTRAEDILQQAFLQAWMAFAGGTEVRDVRPWLYRIVHNAAVNAMRGAAEAHGELSEAEQATAALATESHLQRRMALHDALSDVAALPPMQQQAIFLTAVDGQSHDEVAGVLGISEGALRGLLYRARSTLRSAAAALTPPPILAWASAGAGSGGPTAERLAELSAGGGAAGMAGLLLKGVVVAVTAGALAGGASVLSVHRDARAHATHTHAAQGTSAGAALSAGSFALASDSQIARGLANLHRPAAQDGRSRAGRHGRQGSSRESHRHGGGADERHGGEPAQRGGDDLLVSDDGGRRLSSGSPGRGDSGSPDLGSGAGGRNSSGGDTRSGGGQGSGGNGSGQGGSGHDGSGQGGSGGSGASLADSPADSPGAPAADQTSGTQQSPVVGADELATASGGRQSSTGGGDS
jgi:RNA polymerase sigma factor (sigma-70 family)